MKRIVAASGLWLRLRLRNERCLLRCRFAARTGRHVQEHGAWYALLEGNRNYSLDLTRNANGTLLGDHFAHADRYFLLLLLVNESAICDRHHTDDFFGDHLLHADRHDALDPLNNLTLRGVRHLSNALLGDHLDDLYGNILHALFLDPPPHLSGHLGAGHNSLIRHLRNTNRDGIGSPHAARCHVARPLLADPSEPAALRPLLTGVGVGDRLPR